MSTLKNTAFALIATFSLTACSTMNAPISGGIAATSTSPTLNQTKRTNIGEKNRIENLGYSKSQYKKMLPTGKYERFSVNYEGGKPIIKRINGYDMIKTNYTFTNHVNSIRYGFVALATSNGADIARASLRIISQTGSGDLDTDDTVSSAIKAAHPRRDFSVAVDKDGRIFELKEMPMGDKETYCNQGEVNGCLYEQAYTLDVSPEFMRYYANGGSFMLVSKDRLVEIYVPKEMVKDFYDGLKQVAMQ